ncbi:MAG: DUF4382 domain-containing protein [Deltaproteobacteria bacterium]|nr:MAG: DUF4382 domain-containing protein [Deltaproteobacteria bacterium]
MYHAVQARRPFSGRSEGGRMAEILLEGEPTYRGAIVRTSLVVLLFSVLAVSCGGSSKGMGQLKISLTDAPSDLANVSQVNVTFDEIRVHDDASTSFPDGGAPDAGASEDGSNASGWIVLCTDTQTIDLLSLTGGRFTPLCSRLAADGGVEEMPVDVPAGNISQVRLHLVGAQLVFNDATPSTDVTVPSGTTSGLKVDVNQTVPQGGVLEIKLDFDAAQSIHKTGNGKYLMQPVIRVVP